MRQERLLLPSEHLIDNFCQNTFFGEKKIVYLIAQKKKQHQRERKVRKSVNNFNVKEEIFLFMSR